jgi:hypothetical protein
MRKGKKKKKKKRSNTLKTHTHTHTNICSKENEHYIPNYQNIFPH